MSANYGIVRFSDGLTENVEIIIHNKEVYLSLENIFIIIYNLEISKNKKKTKNNKGEVSLWFFMTAKI